MITSKKLLDITGISRATLNNYIKSGLLPRPVVGPPPPEHRGAKHIGYFAPEIVERVECIRRLKGQGLNMAEIAVRLGGDDTGTPVVPPGQSRSLPGSVEIGKPTCGGRRYTGAGAAPDLSTPAMHDFAVISATLQGGRLVRRTLLPDRYFEMLDSFWRGVGPVPGRYGGVDGEHSAETLLCYFVRDGDSAYLRNCLKCAAELSVVTLKEHLPVDRHGVTDRVALNVGVHVAQDYLGQVQAGNGKVCVTPGFAGSAATVLSRLGKGGEVWASRDFITRLSPGERDGLRFGVSAAGSDSDIARLNPESFAPISILFDNREDLVDCPEDLASLSVARIFF